MSTQVIDQAKVEAFLERFVGDAAAAAHAATVAVGHRLGLYRALAEGGPQTPAEVAARTGSHPRLVQEWLNAQAASGYCQVDAVEGRYWLSPEQAACLADETGPAFVVGNMAIVNAIHKDEEALRAAFTGSGGLEWHAHHADLFPAMAQTSETDYAPLVPEWIPVLDGVEEKLRAGGRVADVGCGFGGSLIDMARAYPASTFAGFDYHEGSIAAARKAAAEARVSDRVTFEVCLADRFPGQGYDLICTFDAIHDMGDPVGVARRIRGALGEGGVWLIVDLNTADDVSGNLDPLGRLLYSASTFLCVPNALSQGGDMTALGAVAGEARLREVALAAGFTRVRRVAETPFNMVLEAR